MTHPLRPLTRWLFTTSASRRACLRLLAAADRDQLPIDRVFRMASVDEPLEIREAMETLADRIASGTPLIEALAQSRGLVDANDVLALRVARATGTMSEALDDLSGVPPSGRTTTRWAKLNAYLVYAMTLMLFLSVSSFCLIFLLPTYEKMFEEFELQMPWVSRTFSRGGAYVSTLVGMFIFVPILGWTIGSWLPPSLNPQNWLGHDRVDVWSLFARSQRAGRPVLATIEAAAQHHPAPRTRRRLARAGENIAAGDDPWRALAEVRLLAPEQTAALAVSDDSQTRAWLLQKWSDRDRREPASAAAIIPAMTVAVAVAVLWFALSMFLPLVELISSLA